MSLLDQNLKTFIDEVDSISPAPGGGSVAALVSSLGIALGKMVSHLTVGRKKFASLDETIQKEYQQNFLYLNQLKEGIIPLIDADTAAFNEIMNAFKLPKDTDEQMLKRNDEIEVATMHAIKVPQEVARLSLFGLETLQKMLPFGNPNALSDIGVGALLLYAGIESAILNIRINLKGLTNQDNIGKFKHYCSDVLDDAKRLRDHILNEIYKEI